MSSLTNQSGLPAGSETKYRDQSVVHLRVRPDSPQICEVYSSTPPSLNAGQAMLRIQQFALTSNNITYALVGRQMGYYDFFPVSPEWACLPAWGFAEVMESKHPGLQAGELLFGFIPMASHWIMSVGEIFPLTVNESSQHRQCFSPFYNTYWRMSGNRLFKTQDMDKWSLFWPLFMTAFSLATYLEDQGLGENTQIIMSSASSKTALCLASILREVGKPSAIIGLTSSTHTGFVRETGYYDHVFSYNEITAIEAQPSIYIDVCGHLDTLTSVHTHLSSTLLQSVMLGATNWQGFHGLQVPAMLPGPKPFFFFAPEHINNRFEQWGGEGILQRIEKSWFDFLSNVSHYNCIHYLNNDHELLAAYLQAFGGEAQPSVGFIAKL